MSFCVILLNFTEKKVLFSNKGPNKRKKGQSVKNPLIFLLIIIIRGMPFKKGAMWQLWYRCTGGLVYRWAGTGVKEGKREVHLSQELFSRPGRSQGLLYKHHCK